MSRSPALEPATRARIVRLLADICVPEERIRQTSRSCIEVIHENANDDDTETTNGHEITEYDECILTNVTLQSNVDFQRYMGKWYEIAKKRTTEEYEVPDSTTTILRMIDNNTIAMQLDLFRVFNKCMDVTVNGVATTNGAQWTVTFDPVGDGEIRTAPYWIIETDYDNYALVYGCKTHEDGTCSHSENTVYVMGRQETLSQRYMDRVNEILPLLCIEPDDIILTKPDECRRFPLGTEKCLVEEFPTVKDFDVLKLHGEWFQIGRQLEVDGASFPIMRTLSFLPHPDDDSDIKLILKGVKLSGVCVEQDIVAHGYSIKSRTGALTIYFPRWMSDHGISNEVKYQVVHTDFKNIVVMYGCRVLNGDGSCQLGKNNFLVLSRTKSPTVTSSDQILEIASLLCIESSQIVFDQVQAGFTHVPQSLPSLHVTPRKCNPEREVYGCCTLIDAPAVGPNNEGCPSIHEIQPGINSVNKQEKCWEELQTVTEDGATTYLTCNDDGTYTEVQCDASLGACWCVDRQTGQSKPGSVTTIMEQPDCSLTNCQRHKKRIDDYLSRIDMKAMHFYRPNCEHDGTYAPTQCFNSWRYCWCVDTETGKKFPGTLAQGTLPVCSDKFEALKNSFGI
ncbi:uncharacterized protein LOC117116713 isoform X2 [Anneissia japonica]|uniref:uncharacterized protein LOC117116713 isoform X2 n=1 Tax=Anneissia japonica TaxID=1529436 RepID=UPI0014257665|nr:uncharacterized protein LOC117116713 isoform X2 [Anneissia japonica]